MLSDKANLTALALFSVAYFFTSAANASDISELIYEHKDGICVVYQNGKRATISDRSPVALQDGGSLELAGQKLTYVGPYGRKVNVERTALLKLGNGDTVLIDSELRKRRGDTRPAADIAPTKSAPSHVIRKVDYRSREMAVLTFTDNSKAMIHGEQNIVVGSAMLNLDRAGNVVASRGAEKIVLPKRASLRTESNNVVSISRSGKITPDNGTILKSNAVLKSQQITAIKFLSRDFAKVSYADKSLAFVDAASGIKLGYGRTLAVRNGQLALNDGRNTRLFAAQNAKMIGAHGEPIELTRASKSAMKKSASEMITSIAMSKQGDVMLEMGGAVSMSKGVKRVELPGGTAVSIGTSKQLIVKTATGSERKLERSSKLALANGKQVAVKQMTKSAMRRAIAAKSQSDNIQVKRAIKKETKKDIGKEKTRSSKE